MALINGYFILDDLSLNIANESIMNLSNQCVIAKYVFYVKIRVFMMVGNVLQLKLNNIAFTSDAHLIELIKQNKDKFSIVYDGKCFIEFAINSQFKYVKYEDGYLHAQMQLSKICD